MLNDRYIIPLFVAGTILLVLFAFFLVAYLLVQKRKQNAYYIEKQKMIHDTEMKMLAIRLEEQEKTMSQISKDIHDNVSQVLSHAITNTRILSLNKPVMENEENALLVNNTNDLLADAIYDLRNISHSLNSDYIKIRGLADTLRSELKRVNASKNLKADLYVEGVYRTLDREKELVIYRIAQEAIHNTIKHSKATILNITLYYQPASFVMKIADNGIGFDSDKTSDLNGIGLINMAERAKILDGTLAINAKQGCTITLRAAI